MNHCNHLNFNIIIKILLLLGFAAFFLLTIIKGSVSLYVHPRIIPYMIFASSVMIFIALMLFQKLWNPKKEKTKLRPFLFFIIPLIMAFAFPAKSFDSETNTMGDIQLSGGETIQQVNKQNKKNTKNAEGYDSSSNSVDAVKNNESVIDQNGVITMDSNNYYQCLCNIYDHLDQYKGKSIEVVGFVFKEKDKFAENEFVPARMLMVCCAADMQTVGFLCKYDKTSELAANSWVKVKGTLEETEFNGDISPCIIAQSVEKAEEPEQTYIYPY